MNRRNRLSVLAAGLCVSLMFFAAEEITVRATEKGEYDFVVSRAVMPLPDLVKIVRKNISKRQQNASANGVICLKGGNLESEIQSFRKIIETIPISNWYEEEWFKEKYLIYLPL